jgi:hypothetical protein
MPDIYYKNETLMKYISLGLTNLAITILILSLTGCANRNAIQFKHMSTIQEWKNTVSRTNSRLIKHHKIHFSAQLIVQYTPSGDEFTLDGFSIGKDLTENSIDLLNPHFSKVKACSWKCYYLGDILESSIFPAQTYLTRFYNANKSELDHFYDIINRINLTVLNYSADEQLLFINMIMSSEQNQFNNLTELEAFVLNAYRDAVAGNPGSALLRGPTNITYAHSKLSYIRSPIGKVYNRDSDIIKAATNQKNSTYGNKDLAQAQTVCSIQENNFGKVIEIDGDKITVHLKGQVKINNDGIYISPSPGYLFDTLSSFAYMDIDAVKVFDRKDLFKCDVGDG